jgi:rhomboid protease GluP
VCRNCGALVGAGESVCEVCGMSQEGLAASRADAPGSVHDREAIRFARAVLGRPYIFTIIFLIANFFVFLMMWTESGLHTLPLLEPFPQPVLIAFGAKLNYLIRTDHEYWRFVTPVFIHINLIHLLVNMYSLWAVGPYVEKLYGSAKFVVFWVLTGVAGVVASYLTVRPDLHVSSVGRFLFKATDMPSAGASGALFGLVGVLFVFGIKFRRELPDGFKRAFGTGLLPMIMINLFIGYMGRGFIDNAAHLGGFVAGAACALVVGYKRPGAQGSAVPVIWHALQVCALLLVAASFLMVERRFPAELPKTQESTASQSLFSDGSGVSAFVSNLNAVNEAQTAFIKAFDNYDVSEIDKASTALDAAPHVDGETDAVRDGLKSLLARIKAHAEPTLKPVQRKDLKARAKEREGILKDFQAWHERYEKWTDNESERLGVKLTKETPAPHNPPNDK